MNIHLRTAAELAGGIRAGEFSSEEVTRHFMGRIARGNDRLKTLLPKNTDKGVGCRQAGAVHRQPAIFNGGIASGEDDVGKPGVGGGQMLQQAANGAMDSGGAIRLLARKQLRVEADAVMPGC